VQEEGELASTCLSPKSPPSDVPVTMVGDDYPILHAPHSISCSSSGPKSLPLPPLPSSGPSVSCPNSRLCSLEESLVSKTKKD